jgi:hypothetical protein
MKNLLTTLLLTITLLQPFGVFAQPTTPQTNSEYNTETVNEEKWDKEALTLSTNEVKQDTKATIQFSTDVINGLPQSFVNTMSSIGTITKGVIVTTIEEGKVCIQNGGLQECLSSCGTALDATITGAPVAMLCDTTNGLIYYANGEKLKAGASMLAIVPFAGTTAKKVLIEATEQTAKKLAKELAEKTAREVGEKALVSLKAVIHGSVSMSKTDAIAYYTKLYPNIPKMTGELKPFTEANYRHNLKVFTSLDVPIPSMLDAHHVFPQKFRADFAGRGVNIDDPQFMRWWKSNSAGGDHQTWAKAYNDGWDVWLKDNATVTTQQILDKGLRNVKIF